MVPSSSDHPRLIRAAAVASVATAGVLVAVKTGAWFVTGAVSVLASLIDSLMDIMASVITLIAVHYALTPADEDHRLGHGKAESLAGLGQATFVAGSALFLILHAVDRMIHPAAIERIDIGLYVMVFATVATAGLLAFQRYVIRRTESVAIRADALHYVSDLLTNLSIIAALLLARAGWPGLDPVFGILIALFILRSAWRIGADSVDALMDRELPSEVRERIRQIALSHGAVHGVHEMRTRQSGQLYVIQLHLELDSDLTLEQAHSIADEVEAGIREAFPQSDIIIHQDPGRDLPHSADGTYRAE